jgi:hypothetical protein
MKLSVGSNIVFGVLGAGLLSAGSARASIDLTMNSSNVENYGGVPPSQTLPGGYTWTPGGIIGVYQFTVGAVTPGDPSGLTSGQTFWSTCLSPGGDVEFGTYTYNYDTFAQSNPGINPPAWATGPGGELWGIQNAAYLWSQFGSSTTALQASAYHGGNQNDAGEGLVMAMYEALYDSTGFGVLGGAAFNPTGLGSQVQTNIVDDLSVLNPAAVSNNLAVGYMFDPQSPAASGPSGQSFIIMAPGAYAPEPMTTSLFAGSCAMLAVAGNAARRKLSSISRS